MAAAKKNRKATKSLAKGKKIEKLDSPLVFQFKLVAVKTISQ